MFKIQNKQLNIIFSTLLCATMLFAVALTLPACKSKTFYEFEDAYRNGFLTDDDLRDISYYSQGYVYTDNDGNIDYIPATEPPVLSAKQEKRILTAFKKWYNQSEDYSLDDLTISKYLGKYNSYMVIELHSDIFKYMFTEASYKIGELYFDINPHAFIFIWG